MNPVQDAIAQAAAAAANTPATNYAVAEPAQQGGAVAVAQPGAALSMETLMMGGMSVEGWIKVDKYGLQFGDTAGLANDVEVMLDMSEGVGFVPKMAIKGGNPAQYRYTIDGVTCPAGGSWANAQSEIRAIAPTASPYRCVDLPFTLLTDVTVLPPGAKPNATPSLAAKAGQRLGYTTSTTNWANWETFYREVAKAGLLGKKVKVVIGAQHRTNKAGNEWGVMTFKLIEEMVEEDAE